MGGLDGILMNLSFSGHREMSSLRERARCFLQEEDSRCHHPKRRGDPQTPPALEPPSFASRPQGGKQHALELQGRGQQDDMGGRVTAPRDVHALSSETFEYIPSTWQKRLCGCDYIKSLDIGDDPTLWGWNRWKHRVLLSGRQEVSAGRRASGSRGQSHEM